MAALTAAGRMAVPTPAARGFRMPAEWERHQATWIAWPHNRSDWPGKHEAIPWVYVTVVRQLSHAEGVEILLQPGLEIRRIRRQLVEAGADLRRVRFHRVRTNRSWTRDYVPAFVRRGRRLALVDWHFNGWSKYSNWRHDDAVGRAVAGITGLERFVPEAEVAGRRRRVVMEGGGFDTNGRGLLLTTEECLLSAVQARNPGLRRRQVEEVLCAWLGVEKILWLGRGIVGDDTHGHVDDLARFVAEDAVVTVTEGNRNDANHALLAENLRRLRRMRDLEGRRLSVHTLPMPDPVEHRGIRLPASYANFYLANGLVLVPQFSVPQDRPALEVMARLLPRRRVVGIPARDLVWGLGTLHCMTQQQPAI